MAKVTGIGGIFFKARDPAALRAWYQEHLGVDVTAWGGAVFPWAGEAGQPVTGATIWNITSADSHDCVPANASFVINYRVDDLHTLLQSLRSAGCQVLDKTDDSEYGKFGWVTDPEGNKIELWQPPAGQ